MFGDDSDKYLVFEAILDSDEDDDKDRVFMIQYFLSNKTIQIFEKKDLKKRIDGGRFLSRMAVKDPRTGENYGDDAFYVGAKIQTAGRIFELVNAPEYTFCQMEAHSDRFKQADLQYAVDELSNYVKSVGVDLKAEFEGRDQNKSGKVTESDARKILFSFIPGITKQVGITILRRFVNNGNFDYASLVKYL
ncbi:hypothetical protein M9Y10_001671 [Tritrichomonas musculus]|uniref:DM10 domain-containing protein n=1 Tax=Tritrichomonas musculus TaxID=1915356 RepID=A0ABR2L9C9_9EUKA